VAIEELSQSSNRRRWAQSSREILSRIHRAGFKSSPIKSMRLTKEEAGGFYAVHRDALLRELNRLMSSGKNFAMVLEPKAPS